MHLIKSPQILACVGGSVLLPAGLALPDPPGRGLRRKALSLCTKKGVTAQLPTPITSRNTVILHPLIQRRLFYIPPRDTWPAGEFPDPEAWGRDKGRCVRTGEVGIGESAIAENPCPFGSRLLVSVMWWSMCPRRAESTAPSQGAPGPGHGLPDIFGKRSFLAAKWTSLGSLSHYQDIILLCSILVPQKDDSYCITILFKSPKNTKPLFHVCIRNWGQW